MPQTALPLLFADRHSRSVVDSVRQHVLWLAVELLQNEVTEKLPSEAENLQTAIVRLQSALSKAYQYVDDVVVSCNYLVYLS